jgi:DNA-directed RNA polymerase subunit E'/Rpb7
MANNNGDFIGPYLNTEFSTIVGLHPNQMTKKLYEHLKNNLIKKYQNKCFNSYGYIAKIYSITEKEGGLITPENSLAPAIFKVKFVCKLCRPLKGSHIICEVRAINKAVIYLRNGPIQGIIFDGYDQINKNNFTFDDRRNVLIGHIGDGKGVKVIPGTFVKVKCEDIRIENGTNRIIIWPILDSVATDEESEKSNIEKELEEELQHFDFEEYKELEIVEETISDDKQDDTE